MYKLIASFLLMILFAAEVSSESYPLDYWARRDAVSNVSLSPDGSKFALLRILERGGNPIIEVYETDNLDDEPRRIDSNPMEITGFSWITGDVLLFSARQQVRDDIEGFNQGTYERKNATYDHSKNKLGQIRQPFFSIRGLLPSKPNKILISLVEGAGGGLQRKDKAVRSGFYEYDVKTNRKRLITRPNETQRIIAFDGLGNPTYALGYSLNAGGFTYYWRPKGTKDWELMHFKDKDNFEEFRIFGPDPEKDNHFLVLAHNGYDKAGIWSYDAKNKAFAEAIYRRNDVDASQVIYHSNSLAFPDTPVGIRWCKDKCYNEFFDAEEAALYQQLEALLPADRQIYVTDRSMDGNTLIIYTYSPRDPGTYYLIRNGRISEISGSKPYLKYEDLSDVEYITYKARDGREIPAYLTVPKGEGPFPLIVMPHGGPYVSETIDRHDEWAQMLSHYGYMVLQPQFRGSKKYGLEFYQSAFINGSETGRAMQDDKDDGALHLVKEGRVDADRIAMFGWSYGGYAALIAAAREDQIYQCAIAGAAVSDPDMQLDYYRYQMDGTQKIEQLTTWDGSVSPIKEVDKVNIPLLVVHPSADQRVPPEHYYKYVKALEKAGIPHKTLLLDGADHFYTTLFYDHKSALYQSILDFLSDDCGLENSSKEVAASN